MDTGRMVRIVAEMQSTVGLEEHLNEMLSRILRIEEQL
jgi:hypothetical protein